MNFQICSKRLFLTYPECPITKERALEVLQAKIPTIDKYVIASEKHQNGNDHLHCYLELTEQLRSRDSRFADIEGYHGNYQGCRSTKNVAKYVTKEDNFIANFDIGDVLTKSTTEKKVLAKRIIEGESLLQIVQEQPQLLFGYKRLKEDVETWRADFQSEQRDCDLPDEIPNPWGLRLQVETDIKKCHYWFYSTRPNKGKTTGVILPLVRDFNAVVIDPKSTYHEIRKTTKVICLDEIKKGDLKYNELNRWCDGFGKFRVFFGGNIELIAKPLIIICSNFSIDEVFPFKNELIHARFNEVDVSDLSFT